MDMENKKNFFIIRVFDGKTQIFAREIYNINLSMCKYIKKPYKNETGGFTIYLDIPVEEYTLTLLQNKQQ